MSKPILVDSSSPSLRVTCQSVGELTKRMRRELANLSKFVEGEDHAIAVAASQLGIPLRAFAYRRVDGSVKIVCDPRVTWTSADVEDEAVVDEDGMTPKLIPQWEQCLSLPGFKFLVSRPYAIKVEYTNERGVHKRETLTDFSARVFLHELDHMDGILISDRGEQMADVTEDEERTLSL